MILVDDRAGSKDLLDIACMEGHCESARLDFDVDGSGKLVACGDAMLVGNGPGGSSITIGVELKSLSDVLTSISTGRLGGTQIPRMLKVYDCVFLLIFGQYRPGPSNHLQVRKGKLWKNFRIGRHPVPWSYLEGFFLTAQMIATFASKPLFVKNVYDLREAATWLTVLDHWLEKSWDKHRGLSVFDKSREVAPPPDADPVEVQIARQASQLPVIDWVRGWEAARHFDSVADMIAASVSEWQEVHGIGKVIAHSAYEIIHRRKRR